MNKHEHEHKHDHDHKHHSGHPTKKAPHKDWRLWAVVVLMLAAIAAYVLTMDESIIPGRTGEQPEVPAAE
jgi:hypothetical protein